MQKTAANPGSESATDAFFNAVNSDDVNATQITEWFTTAYAATGNQTVGQFNANTSDNASHPSLEGQVLVKGWPYLTAPHNQNGNYSDRELHFTNNVTGDYEIGPRFTTTGDVLRGIGAALNSTTGNFVGNVTGADWAVLGAASSTQASMEYNAMW